MEIQPKKYVYHTYEEPTNYEHKAQPPKYELKEHYQYTKEPSPKIEYHLPKEYYSHQKYQQYHRESPKPVQGYKHTVYRGNNDSNEEVHYEEEAQESKEVHQDIHVYHWFSALKFLQINSFLQTTFSYVRDSHLSELSWRDFHLLYLES